MKKGGCGGGEGGVELFLAVMEVLKTTTHAARPSFGKSAEQTLYIQDNPDEVS